MDKMLKIEISDVVACRDIKIIKVSGELAINNSNNFKVTAEGLIEKGIINLIIDLSDLRFIDSFGTLNLINIYYKTKQRRGNMCLFGVNSDIMDVFDTVGLAKLVPVYNDKSEAIANIRNKKNK